MRTGLTDVLPATAAVQDGELTMGGVRTSALADEFGTPLVVYCEQTMLDQARAYRRAAPDALVVYSVKAFQNLALLRLFAGEGLGADVSTLGELTFALRAGVPGERIVVHGNNKSDEELRAAADAGASLVVLDALDEVERAAAAGVTRVLVRATPGIDAETHDAIKTAHYGSKFGLPPEQTLEAIDRATRGRPRCRRASRAHRVSAARTGRGEDDGRLARRLRGRVPRRARLDTTDRRPRRWARDPVRRGRARAAVGQFVETLIARLARSWKLHDLPLPQLILEPGRSLVGRAGLTLYRVGTVKQASETTTYVAIDGGMSDNPRPQLYGARYTALLANRADEPAGTRSRSAASTASRATS